MSEIEYRTLSLLLSSASKAAMGDSGSLFSCIWTDRGFLPVLFRQTGARFVPDGGFWVEALYVRQLLVEVPRHTLTL